MSAMKKIIYLSFALCAFVFLSVKSENVNYRFRKLSVDNGLPHTDVLSIKSDSRGLLWLGTKGGLVRYDGLRMHTFLYQNNPKKNVNYNRISTICVTNTDDIFVSSEGGLQKFNTRLSAYQALKFRNAADTVLAQMNSANIMVDRQDNLWLYDGPMLMKLIMAEDSVLSVTSFTKKFSFPNGSVFFDVKEDAVGNIWCGTSRGLFCITLNDRNGTFKSMFRINSRKWDDNMMNTVNAFNFDNTGKIWAVNQDGVMVISLKNNIEGDYMVSGLDTYKFRTYCTSDKFEFENLVQVDGIEIDESNCAWIQSRNGLIRFELSGYKNTPEIMLFQNNPDNAASISGNSIIDLYLDKNQVLYIGSWNAGLNILDIRQKRFGIIQKEMLPPGIVNKSFFVRSIYEARDGNVWIGTQNDGVIIYNPQDGTYKNLELQFGKRFIVSNAVVYSFLEDEYGSMWIGTSNGLYRYHVQNKTVDSYFSGSANSTLANNLVSVLKEDHLGRIWAGSWQNGLTRIEILKEGLVFKRFNTTQNTEGLTSDKINDICVDHEKRELLVSTSKGLHRFIFGMDGEILEIIPYQIKVNKAGSLASEYIWPIQKQNDSTYWLGTLGGGLSKFVLRGHNDYFATNYTVLQGASTNDVEGLLYDAAGYLWVSGKGVSRFDIKNENFQHFDKEDGLQSNVFKVNASAKGKSGLFYFGGTHGLNFFKPSEIQNSTFNPYVLITDLSVHNELIVPEKEKNGQRILQSDITFTSNITLNYKNNNFILSFASMQLVNPDKNRFKYKLENYDDDWIITNSGQSSAFYSNLPRGKYTFKVQGTNNDGVWSDKTDQLLITIVPPWHKTYLAYVIYLLLTLLLLYYLRLYAGTYLRLKHDVESHEEMTRRKDEIYQMKLRFFTNISHEFRTPLTLIISPLEKLLSKEPERAERKEYYYMMKKNSERMLYLVNELMDFRKIETGKTRLMASYSDFSAFVENICSGFIAYADQEKLIFTRNVPFAGLLWFDKAQTEKIVYNLLSNAFKNTLAGGKITVAVHDAPGTELKPYFKDYLLVGEMDKSVDYVQLVVQDTGIGISKQSLESVFDRFFQIENTDRHLGSGVGLAMVKSLVLLQKGFIVLSSERDSGTEFIIGFRKGDAHLDQEDKIDDIGLYQGLDPKDLEVTDEPIGSSLGTDETHSEVHRILLVEDNDQLRKFIKAELSTTYQVVEAVNGEDALHLVTDLMPDLIVTDVMMPIMDGIEFTKRVKNNIETSHIPVIMLTARSAVDQQVEGMEAGADIYLTKPLSIRLLELNVKNMLDKLTVLKSRFGHEALTEARTLFLNQKDQKFMDKVIVIIEKNIDNEQFSVDDLAIEAGMGRTRFFQKIKALTNMSPRELIRSIRIKKAAQLLVVHDLTITEVKDMVGIGSMSYFIKSFKEIFEQTPAQYVKEHTNMEQNKIDITKKGY